MQLYGIVLLQPYTELFLNNWMEINAQELDKKTAFNASSARFIPISNVVYRMAWLQALANRQAEARLQVERAIWAYPADFAVQKNELSALAQKDPEHFAALLEFAIKKNEEYVNAVSAK